MLEIVQTTFKQVTHFLLMIIEVVYILRLLAQFLPCNKVNPKPTTVNILFIVVLTKLYRTKLINFKDTTLTTLNSSINFKQL